MPEQNETPNQNANAINVLATKIKMEQAEYQLRLANYYVPYGFNPEQEDFVRAGQLLEKNGNQITAKVFSQASPTVQERVTFAANEIAQRQESMEALFAAGAEVQVTDEQLYEHAVQRLFGTTRAGQQAAHANVA